MTADGFLKEPLHAIDTGTLELVDGLLHDESFDLEEIAFDQEAHIVTIPVRRMFHSGPERLIKAGFFSKTYEKDWMRSMVTLRKVLSWDVWNDQGINTYDFHSWRYKKETIEVESLAGMVLKFVVESIDVEIKDIGFKGKARIKRGWRGIESFSGKVYE